MRFKATEYTAPLDGIELRKRRHMLLPEFAKDRFGEVALGFVDTVCEKVVYTVQNEVELAGIETIGYLGGHWIHDGLTAMFHSDAQEVREDDLRYGTVGGIEIEIDLFQNGLCPLLQRVVLREIYAERFSQAVDQPLPLPSGKRFR